MNDDVYCSRVFKTNVINKLVTPKEGKLEGVGMESHTSLFRNWSGNEDELLQLKEEWNRLKTSLERINTIHRLTAASLATEASSQTYEAIGGPLIPVSSKQVSPAAGQPEQYPAQPHMSTKAGEGKSEAPNSSTSSLPVNSAQLCSVQVTASSYVPSRASSHAPSMENSATMALPLPDDYEIDVRDGSGDVYVGQIQGKSRAVSNAPPMAVIATLDLPMSYDYEIDVRDGFGKGYVDRTPGKSWAKELEEISSLHERSGNTSRVEISTMADLQDSDAAPELRSGKEKILRDSPVSPVASQTSAFAQQEDFTKKSRRPTQSQLRSDPSIPVLAEDLACAARNGCVQLEETPFNVISPDPVQ